MRSGPKRRSQSRTWSGSVYAALPTTARAAPKSSVARDGRGVAKTAAHLQFHARFGGQLGDDRLVGRGAVEGAVQVDHMQPIRAKAPILGEQRAGFGVVAGLRRKVAAQQPHAAAGLQIDRGNEAHGSV